MRAWAFRAPLIGLAALLAASPVRGAPAQQQQQPPEDAPAEDRRWWDDRRQWDAVNESMAEIVAAGGELRAVTYHQDGPNWSLHQYYLQRGREIYRCVELASSGPQSSGSPSCARLVRTRPG